MADYSSWKVADLKAELKRRNIPQTGLRLKQQIIDRLLQADATEEPATTSTQQQPKAVEPEPEGKSEPEAAAEKAQEPEEPQAPAEQPINGEETATFAETTAQEVPTQDVSADSAPEPVSTEKPGEEAQEPSSTADQVALKSASPKAADQPAQPPVEEQAEPMEQDAIPPSSVPSAPKTTTAPGPAEHEPTPLPSEDSVDDSRKRKRRSQSPPPSPRTAAQKKAKAEHGEPRVILGNDVPEKEASALPQDKDVEMTTAEPPKETQDEHADRVERSPGPDDKAEPSVQEPSRPDEEGREDERADKVDETQAAKRSVGDARFKGLFPAANGEQLRQEAAPSQVESENRIVEPALHPATTSIYIRDFMRPLQPATLKMHLASLATPPGSSPDPDTITTFFLDSIKTHCFVTFTSVSAASRVRLSLHGNIWPEERTRKPLWVDFVPEEKVQQWIETEQNSGNGGRGAPRWEISYEDTEHGVSAVLQEAVPNRGNQQARGNRDIGITAPTGPRADRDMPRGSQSSSRPPNIPNHGFKALDDRFQSTTAKPKLYYLPVSRDIADKRLDQFDDLARAGPTDKRGGDEMRKYTFEDTDFFVDRGPEYGRRGPRGGRGGGRGGGYGDFGGGWRDGNWRGRR